MSYPAWAEGLGKYDIVISIDVYIKIAMHTQIFIFFKFDVYKRFLNPALWEKKDAFWNFKIPWTVAK